MTGSTVDNLRARLQEAQADSAFRCPECGSFLDAPRVNPLTGQQGRKCVACHDWHPMAAGWAESGKQ